MFDELDQVLVPCWNLSLEGQDDFLSIPLSNIFPNNERVDDDQFFDDAYMKDVIVFDTDDDIMEFLEDALLDEDPPNMISPASKLAIEGSKNLKIDERSLVVCSVYFEDVSIGTEAKRLLCTHVYRTGCIFKWHKERNTCPLCRYKMPILDFDLNVPLLVIDSDVDSKNMIATN